jgi:signal transduction histidine kinase
MGCDLGNVCAKAERLTSEKSVNENVDYFQIQTLANMTHSSWENPRLLPTLYTFLSVFHAFVTYQFCYCSRLVPVHLFSLLMALFQFMFFFFIVLTIALSRFLFYLLHFEISKFGASKIVCLKKTITNCFQLCLLLHFILLLIFTLNRSSLFGGRGVGFSHGLWPWKYPREGGADKSLKNL